MSTQAKDLRHPLKRARGLGSAQFGVAHWWTQRTTALALIPLSVWFVIVVLGLLQGDYEAARRAVAQPWNAVLLIAFLISMFWHAVLGMQVVVEDYVHTRWKEITLLVLIKSIAVLCVLGGTLAVLRIALGA